MANTQHTQHSMNNKPQQSQHPTAQQLLRNVWQDKTALLRGRTASRQPAPQKEQARVRTLNTQNSRTQKKHSTKRQTVSLHLWVKPGVKEELQRIAQSEGLSISKTGGAFIEKAIQSDLHTQHGALLEKVIESTIQNSMHSYSSRLALLLVRVAFDGGQTRALVTNILSRQPGVTPELLQTILDGSSNTAKRNITQKTPQLERIIDELARMFHDGEETSW